MYEVCGQLIGKQYKVLRDEGRNWVWIELEVDKPMAWPIKAKDLVVIQMDEPDFGDDNAEPEF